MRPSASELNRTPTFVGSIITSLVFTGVLCCWSVNAYSLFFDTFDGPSRLITSEQFYAGSEFPRGGTSTADNPSMDWEMGTGRAFATNGWLYFGTPREYGNSNYVRFNSRRFDYGDAVFSWMYRSGPFGGSDGYPTNGAEAVALWVRYQTQYNLYVIQFDRMDNRIYAKRKVPAQGWRGNAVSLANKGVYYSLRTDSWNPGGAGEPYNTWSNAGMPDLDHDTNTFSTFKASVITLANGNVQLRLWRDRQLVASWTDNNDSIGPGNETFAEHLAKDYFDSVPGWQEEWGQPIARAGATGFRADNIKIWIDNFTVSTPLNIHLKDGEVVIDWVGVELQSSDNLITWRTEPVATTPVIVSPAEMKFYRIKN